MVNEKEKTTVPIPSVGADGEQPIFNNTTGIISTDPQEINSKFPEPEENLDENQRKKEQIANPIYSHNISAMLSPSHPPSPPMFRRTEVDRQGESHNFLPDNGQKS